MTLTAHIAGRQRGKSFARCPDQVRSALAEAGLDVIDTIGTLARDHRAGHVLVAGDVFDNLDTGERILVQALSRMSRASSSWWLVPGNHARTDGLWSRARAQAPANVHVPDRAEAVPLGDSAWLLPAPLQHRRMRDVPTRAGAG